MARGRRAGGIDRAVGVKDGAACPAFVDHFSGNGPQTPSMRRIPWTGRPQRRGHPVWRRNTWQQSD
ncbi:hypothetical protein HMPREF0043_00811 [Actinobaculum sp. oral taxon 183 str. F0552]|nr:hypothetical protein HMPREF0043_00811 [Actinobaculum sp. oral taxon 183 str. F0552]